jgi:hypothetical protein
VLDPTEIKSHQVMRKSLCDACEQPALQSLVRIRPHVYIMAPDRYLNLGFIREGQACVETFQYSLQFTSEEVKSVLQDLDVNKGSGPDGILSF